MSKPRYRWWGYVKWVVRDYPAKCRELEELRYPHPKGGGNDGLPKKRGVSRRTEDIALRGFSGQKEREFEGVRRAVELTRLREDGEDTLVLIDLVYWSQTHTLDGAARKAHMSYRTARRRNREFIMTVARGMGLLDE